MAKLRFAEEDHKLTAGTSLPERIAVIWPELFEKEIPVPCAKSSAMVCELPEGRMSDEFGDRGPSEAEAHVDVAVDRYRLKPVPFGKKCFFAACYALLGVCWPVLCFAGKAKPCVKTDEAVKMIDKDVCVSAHIYDVIQLADGTRFLDVCSPATPDVNCRFTIVSFAQDRDTVGALAQYRDRNVEIRGVVRPMHGRAGIVLSHVRQFHGGPPRFRPNPMLLRGFDAQQDRPPVADPNLRSYGHSRSFMNSRDQETRPAK